MRSGSAGPLPDRSSALRTGFRRHRHWPIRRRDTTSSAGAWGQGARPAPYRAGGNRSQRARDLFLQTEKVFQLPGAARTHRLALRPLPPDLPLRWASPIGGRLARDLRPTGTTSMLTCCRGPRPAHAWNRGGRSKSGRPWFIGEGKRDAGGARASWAEQMSPAGILEADDRAGAHGVPAFVQTPLLRPARAWDPATFRAMVPGDRGGITYHGAFFRCSRQYREGCSGQPRLRRGGLAARGFQGPHAGPGCVPLRSTRFGNLSTVTAHPAPSTCGRDPSCGPRPPPIPGEKAGGAIEVARPTDRQNDALDRGTWAPGRYFFVTRHNLPARTSGRPPRCSRLRATVSVLSSGTRAGLVRGTARSGGRRPHRRPLWQARTPVSGQSSSETSCSGHDGGRRGGYARRGLRLPSG